MANRKCESNFPNNTVVVVEVSRNENDDYADSAPVDRDLILATANMIKRTGALHFRIGHTRDDVPVELAGWFAEAIYDTGTITSGEYEGPNQACEGLVERLLTGALCKCGRIVSLNNKKVAYVKGRLVNGKKWTAEDVAKTDICRWRRLGHTWISECDMQAEHILSMTPSL